MMTLVSRKLFVGLCLIASIASAQDVTEAKHSAVTPVPREGGWLKRHESFNERVKKGNVDLIFIGDSITQAWETDGKEVWQQHYTPRNAVNLGISGDRTQHVLWRLDNGNLEGIKPKLAMIMIGTNNSNRNDNTAEEIADGIKAIVAKLRAKLPETKVLLLAIFPRGPMPNPQREKIARANELASQAADGKMVHYLDIGPKFLTADGTLEKEVMPDYLHLSPKGYQIWAAAIEDSVEQLMAGK
jgi:beta-glucosidase